jgi:hypothetical protein
VGAARPGPYRVRDNCLFARDEELLSGPLLQLEMMCRVLNAAKPRDADLAATVRALIGMTRDCSFAPGERLLRDGTPLRIVQPQKRRPIDAEGA